MARNKIGLQFNGWNEYIEKLEELGGNKAIKEGVESALIASKDYVNPQISKAMDKLPAGGKYSHGGTKKSIDEDKTVEWNGLTAEIKIGFDFSKSGLKSIFLMYGTPRMKPVNGLKSAIYGANAQKKVGEIQQKELDDFIKKFMGGA